ncbi:thioredoxin domain-containing protein [Sphingomonas rhizophila]|uniref:Thioredoxin domain-containing protein n=1 Tax=Sphingomonas rhizophila TaxID=2071607 RepID=A0A7G9S9N7_9SPHN|nr:thioredoxin domain-containing protein [Sphingomonas rhizophila]QNN64562.1 thioredoxin domain-containing protein [Sphingomonas rhizophila]
MKAISLILMSGALALTACNGEKGTGTATGNAAAEPKAVPAPASGDWSEITTESPQGGFIMGNPVAKVKLVEFGSMTCPHCREFDETAAPKLIENYVKKGLVSWEFRNFVRDPYDITASIVARCGGAPSFFGLTRSFYASQNDWIAKLQAATTDPQQAAALQAMPPQQQFKAISDIAGFPTFAAQRGIPKAKLEACLADEAAATKLVQMNSDAVASYPEIPGTPSFLINGELSKVPGTWEALEPEIKKALGQ